MGIQGTYLNIIKAAHDKTTASGTLNGEKAESPPAKIWTRQACPPLSPLLSTYYYKSKPFIRPKNKQTNKQKKKREA